MIHSITVNNVNQALSDLLFLVRTSGIAEDSRNGMVTRLMDPVCVTFKRPWERVLFSAVRDANPFFHLMESLWMLSGHNDLEFLVQFSKRMAEYSDNGVTIGGSAYGYRWREYWDFDQLESLITLFKEQPNTRRGVLGMWCPRDLLNTRVSRDVPCNLAITFQRQADSLVMTVFNRSNDIIWGLTGANAVHMSMLHEYMCRSLDMIQGEYHQISVNAHMYHTEQGQHLMDHITEADDRYTYARIGWLPLFQTPTHKYLFDGDCIKFMSDPTGDNTYLTQYFNHVVQPMMDTWVAHKAGDREGAAAAAEKILAPDWRAACSEWLGRRYDRI